MEATNGTRPCVHHLHIRVCRAVEGLSFLGCDRQSYCPPERTEEHPGDQPSTAPEISRLQPPAAPGQEEVVTWRWGLAGGSGSLRGVSANCSCPGPFLYVFFLLPAQCVSSLYHMLLQL